MFNQVAEDLKAITGAKAQMRRGIREAVRGYWSKVFDRTDFIASMESAIRRGIRAAWRNGAEKAGILENELTEEELREREAFIKNQFDYIRGFADTIGENQKGKGKLSPLMDRAESWANAYDGAFEKAFAMAAGNKKLKWFYSPEKEHCQDCAKYDGRVYRANIWNKYDIHPKQWHLACRGIHCGCWREETSDPVTPGRPPGMTY
jgi:hypothetical protein